MRSALAVSTRSRWRRSGWPGNGSASTTSPGRVYGTKTGPSGVSAAPSPRGPRRKMMRRSVTARSEQEFAVPRAAFDRRWDHTCHPPAERGDRSGDVIANADLHGRIAHDALLQVCPASLELRFHQRDELRRAPYQPVKCRQHELERDEAHIDGYEIR